MKKKCFLSKTRSCKSGAKEAELFGEKRERAHWELPSQLQIFWEDMDALDGLDALDGSNGSPVLGQ